MPRRATSIVLTLALATAASRPALADPRSAERKAAAEVLFEEGKRLKKEGKFLEAAQKLEQSEALDPGIGTLLHLADAYERAGRMASAWGNYRDAADLARKSSDSREKVATGHAQRLEPKLARVRLELGENATLPGLVIESGGVDLGVGIADVPIPVNSGSLALEVRAPGFDPYRTTLTAVDGETLSVKVPPLVKSREPEPPATPSQPTRPRDPPRSGGSASAAPPLRFGLRVGSVAMGVVALGGAGVATAFTLRAKSLDDDAAAFCNGTTCSDPRGEQLSLDAFGAAKVATIASVAGAVAGAAAIGMFVGSYAVPLLPEAAATNVKVVPWAGPGGGGLAFGGRF